MLTDADFRGSVEIDLAALRHNLSVVREQIGNAQLLAMVKADAYGHGLVRVAQTLMEEGVQWLGVARLDEARVLRGQGVQSRLLVMAPISPSRFAEIASLRLDPVLSSREAVGDWVNASAGAAAGSSPVCVHLKIDTGMHRLGLAPSELPGAVELLRRGGGLQLQGVLSHLRESERLDGSGTEAQRQEFERAIEAAALRCAPGILRHLANSAAALHWPATRNDLVRVGGALYGMDLAASSVERHSADRTLRPVMKVRAPIVQLRDIEQGEGVGYNARWRAPRPSRIATVPIGYGDGYPPGLRGAPALLHGRRVPVVGAVSMDLLTLDVTGCPAEVGDEVVMLGSQEGDRIHSHELASRLDEPEYAITCRFSLRLPRLYRA